jgi:hypothetical protein
MRYTLLIFILFIGLLQQVHSQCTTGGAVWLNGQNNGIFRDTGLLGGDVTVIAATFGTMTSGRPLYMVGNSTWKGLNYTALQVWRAYSSIASNYTFFKLDKPLDSTYFHVRVDNIRGDFLNWESQNVRGYLNGVEVAADFKDPVNGATVSNNTISGPSNTSTATQSAMRVFFRGPVDSIVVRQVSVSDWIIAELMIQCNIMLPLRLEKWIATRSNDAVIVSWKNSTEEGVTKYILEKSEDGRQFYPVSDYNPTGGSYQYKDENAGPGKLYYRLKLLMNSGSPEYSTTLMLKPLAVLQSSTHIYPNPVGELFTIALPPLPVSGIVFNAEGRPIFTFETKGSIIINTSTWPRGQYFIRIQTRDELHTERLMKL